MLNLVKNEFIKLLANKKIYVFMLVLIGVNLLPLLESLTGAIGDIPINGQTIPLYMLTTYVNILLPIFLIVFTADMVTEDYATGTLKLSLIHPVSRTKLLTAKVLTLTVLTFFMLIIGMVVGAAVGTIIFGWGEKFIYEDAVNEIIYNFSTVNGLLITLGSYLVSILPLIAFSLIIMLLALQFTSSGAVVGVSFGMLLTLGFLGQVSEGLQPYLINYHFKLFNLIFLAVEYPKALISIAFITILGISCYAASLLLFKRKDIVF